MKYSVEFYVLSGFVHTPFSSKTIDKVSITRSAASYELRNRCLINITLTALNINYRGDRNI